MTGVAALAKAVDPIIADADADRRQGIIADEGLIRPRVVVASREDHATVDVEDFAPSLSVAAQCGGPTVGAADNDLLTIFAAQPGVDRKLVAIRKAQDGAKRDL